MSQENRIIVYDTTLRDGTQRKGMSLSLQDKLKITELLDQIAIPMIEGGWPASNPKDAEYFRQVRKLPLKNSRIAAFGSTRRKDVSPAQDTNLIALRDAETPIVTLVGKSWTLHVDAVLATSREENLAMIEESVAWIRSYDREVVYDAEHFFDGFRADPAYALSTLRAALRGGATWIVLCDTNGGSLPAWVYRVVREVREGLAAETTSLCLGIHTHNDAELAVANAIAAIEGGCTQVQGTINGYGERCGNANLISLIPTLHLKMGRLCIPESALPRLCEVSRRVSEISNLPSDPHAPYVGSAAFAHKGGIHVAAIEKVTHSYEHIQPESVGNRREIVLSELSGKGNIRMLSRHLGVGVGGKEDELLRRVKELESRGFQFEHAQASFDLLVRRITPNYIAPFQVIDALVVSRGGMQEHSLVQAVTKVRVGKEVEQTVSEGHGPVHALDRAIRKALASHFPSIRQVRLADYKVRILNPERATAAMTRVLIEAHAGDQQWATVGCSENLIDASLAALVDSFEYLLWHTELHMQPSMAHLSVAI